MTKCVTVRCQFNARRTRSFHSQVGREESSPLPPNRIPRVSRLMALAIRFDQLIGDDSVVDQAALARLGRVSRARLTQIMNLLTLAPDIQEQILNLAPTAHGRDPPSERHLRPIAAELSWKAQRPLWLALSATYPIFNRPAAGLGQSQKLE
jgi:hypothetical protein